MRAQGLAVAFCVLAAGSVAHAQEAGGISNIQQSAGTSYYLNPFNEPSKVGAGSGVTGAPSVGGSGSHDNSFVDVGEQLITFESESTGSGPYVRTESFSSVSFDVTNNTHQNATFSSTITAAGMGFYLADTSSGCLYTNCPQVAANSGYTFADLFRSTEGPIVGEVGFNFTVTRAGDIGSDPETLYTLSGLLRLNNGGEIYEDIHNYIDLGNDTVDIGPAGVLDGFGEATGYDRETALGYAWDATDFTFGIDDFEHQNLIYKTEVYSESAAACIDGTSYCLVAYSGFGDPVGRGGGVSSFARGAPPRITGINFGPTTLDIPTFEDGGVSFRAAAVPEPSTWVSLILGFGLLGSALRRRRTLAIA
jgi:hypothetical protein